MRENWEILENHTKTLDVVEVAGPGKETGGKSGPNDCIKIIGNR